MRHAAISCCSSSRARASWAAGIATRCTTSYTRRASSSRARRLSWRRHRSCAPRSPLPATPRAHLTPLAPPLTLRPPRRRAAACKLLGRPSSSTEDHRLGARIMMRRVLGHSTTGLQQPAGPAGLQIVNHQDQGVTSLSGGDHSSGSGSNSIYGALRAPTAAAKDVTTPTGPAKQARPAAAGASGNLDATRPAVKVTAFLRQTVEWRRARRRSSWPPWRA